MFGWILLWGRQQFWIKIIWPLFSVSLFAVRSFMSNYPLYNYPSSASSHLMIHFGISKPTTNKDRKIVDIITRFLGKKGWDKIEFRRTSLIDCDGNTNFLFAIQKYQLQGFVHKWHHENCDPLSNIHLIHCLHINFVFFFSDFGKFVSLFNHHTTGLLLGRIQTLRTWLPGSYSVS